MAVFTILVVRIAFFFLLCTSMLQADTVTYFRQQLMSWFSQHQRPLPWKGEKDPYLVWLSEIILQQTRVAQGLPYFERFRTSFPTVHALALATEDEVMKHWEGLGYYSRARNLHATAKYISQELGGVFPSTYADILALRGVGPYTAAAIASFAFDLPHAVLDGNVFRVIARYAGIATPIDSTSGKKQFAGLATELLLTTHPADYNQAIMDFGATVCVPRSPACSSCPLHEQCQAYRQERVSELPVKAKKMSRRTRYFHDFLLNQQGRLWIHKRTDKDIWQDLYEFPLIEQEDTELSEAALSLLPQWQHWLGADPFTISGISPPQKQDLSHQRIIARFWEVQLPATLPLAPGMQMIKRENLRQFAFPKLIDWYLRDNSLFLKLI